MKHNILRKAKCTQYWLSIHSTWEDVCGLQYLALLNRSFWLSWWSCCLLTGSLLFEDVAGGKTWFVYNRHFSPSHTPRWFASTPPIWMVIEQLAHNQRIKRRPVLRTATLSDFASWIGPDTGFQKLPTQLNEPNRFVPELVRVSPNVSDVQVARIHKTMNQKRLKGSVKVRKSAAFGDNSLWVFSLNILHVWSVVTWQL